MHHSNLLASGIHNPVLPQSLGNVGQTGGGTALGNLIGNIVGTIVIVAFLLTLFYLLTGGMSWLTSGGDKTQLETARNKMTNAVLGLIIIAAVWGVMNIVGPFLGINFPNIPIPSIPTT